MRGEGRFDADRPRLAFMGSLPKQEAVASKLCPIQDEASGVP